LGDWLQAAATSTLLLFLHRLREAGRAGALCDQRVEDGHDVARGIEVAVDAGAGDPVHRVVHRVVATEITVIILVLLLHARVALLEHEIPRRRNRGRVRAACFAIVATPPAHLGREVLVDEDHLAVPGEVAAERTNHHGALGGVTLAGVATKEPRPEQEHSARIGGHHADHPIQSVLLGDHARQPCLSLPPGAVQGSQRLNIV